MTDVMKPVTLSDLECAGKLAGSCCNAWGGKLDVPPGDLGLPLHTPIPEVVLSGYGSRKLTVKPELYPRGVEAISST